MVCTAEYKGATVYLHKKGPLNFFSKNKAGAVDLPAGLKIIKNPRTGYPMLKKK